jgi:hypothetical protein
VTDPDDGIEHVDATGEILADIDIEVAFPRLSAAHLDEIRALGEKRTVGVGDFLYRADDETAESLPSSKAQSRLSGSNRDERL